MYKIKKIFKKAVILLNFYKPTSYRWKIKFHYTKEPKTIDILWTKVDTIGFINVPVDIISAGILTPLGLQMKQLEETPHFKLVKDLIENKDDSESRAKYYNYINTFFPDNDTEYE